MKDKKEKMEKAKKAYGKDEMGKMAKTKMKDKKKK
jgi:hypothetical protein